MGSTTGFFSTERPREALLVRAVVAEGALEDFDEAAMYGSSTTADGALEDCFAVVATLDALEGCFTVLATDGVRDLRGPSYAVGARLEMVLVLRPLLLLREAIYGSTETPRLLLALRS